MVVSGSVQLSGVMVGVGRSRGHDKKAHGTHPAPDRRASSKRALEFQCWVVVVGPPGWEASAGGGCDGWASCNFVVRAHTATGVKRSGRPESCRGEGAGGGLKRPGW